MWPQGYQNRWFPSTITRKEGNPPPHRQGFGQTPLRVIQDGDSFYVGTAYVLPSGAEEPYTVESDYFDTEDQAQWMYQKMTGKTSNESLVRDYVRQVLLAK